MTERKKIKNNSRREEMKTDFEFKILNNVVGREARIQKRFPHVRRVGEENRFCDYN